MKKIILAILCLFLAGCGTFDVRVQMLPKETAAALPAATASVEPTSSPEPTSPARPAPLKPTATAFSEPTPTATVMAVDQAITLSAIQMSDTRRGWGVESAGRIVKTSDGGGIWKDVTPSQGKFARHSLFAFNSETVWAVPAQLDVSNVVWRTQDGGSTWVAGQPIALGKGKYSPLSLQFPDARHGWLMLLAQEGDQKSQRVLLYKSEDGGENWLPLGNLNESVAQTYLPVTTTTMAFFDGQTGWLGGWWGKDDPSQWSMLKTADGGVKWGTDSLRLPAQNYMHCNGHPIAEMAPGSMAVEVICTKSNDPKYKFHHLYYLSTNSGPAWRSWVLPGDFLGAYFLNANQGWMMVTSNDPQLNVIQYTKDGGKSWNNVNKVAWKQAQFDFVNDKIGWAIVSNGYATGLVRTENGGKIWIQVRPYLEP